MEVYSDWALVVKGAAFFGGVIGAFIGGSGLMSDSLNRRGWPWKVFVVSLLCIFVGLAK